MRDTLKPADIERINRQVATRVARALRRYFGRDLVFGKLADLPQGQVFVIEASPLFGRDIEVVSFAFTRGGYTNPSFDIEIFFDIVQQAESELGYLFTDTDVFDDLKKYLGESIYGKVTGKYTPYTLIISTGLKVAQSGTMVLSDSLISFSVNSRDGKQFQADGINHSRSTFAAALADPKLHATLKSALKPVKPGDHVPKVFLSYASEDRSAVEIIHSVLMQADIDAWLDVYELVAGDPWRRRILHELKSSDLVVICMSSRAIEKVGFVQAEVRQALEWQRLRPLGAAFIIPVRLDACPLPDELAEYQYLDLFPNVRAKAVELAAAINKQVRRRIDA
jgi:hypothetical protein